MLQKTIEFNKIISGKTQKTAKTDAKDTPLLVYKDAEDEDEEMASAEGSDDEDDDEDDEVITEIDIKKGGKRQKVDEDGDYDEEDESMSFEEKKVSKKGQDDEDDDGFDEEGNDEEIDSDVYGQESDDLQKLAQSSDEEMASEQESEEHEVIKVPKTPRPPAGKPNKHMMSKKRR